MNAYPMRGLSRLPCESLRERADPKDGVNPIAHDARTDGNIVGPVRRMPNATSGRLLSSGGPFGDARLLGDVAVRRP